MAKNYYRNLRAPSAATITVTPMAVRTTEYWSTHNHYDDFRAMLLCVVKGLPTLLADQ